MVTNTPTLSNPMQLKEALIERLGLKKKRSKRQRKDAAKKKMAKQSRKRNRK